MGLSLFWGCRVVGCSCRIPIPRNDDLFGFSQVLSSPKAAVSGPPWVTRVSRKMLLLPPTTLLSPMLFSLLNIGASERFGARNPR